MRKLRYRLAIALAMCSLPVSAHSWPSEFPPFETGVPVRYTYPEKLQSDLVFPTEPVAAFPNRPQSGIVLGKPAGNGPFPAMVVFPTCAGTAPYIYSWGKSLVDDGYVTMVVDLYSPRNLPGTCFTATKVNFQSAPADALLAAEHLRKLPYVKADRIGFMGFSFGGTQGMLAEYQSEKYGVKGFQAVVAFYPPMLIPKRDEPGAYYRLVPDRLKVPTLVVFGDADTETPPDKVMLPMLTPMKAAGDPVEWIIYPGATHSFDDSQKAGRPVNGRGYHGEPVMMSYNHKVTMQAWKDSFAFLAKHLKQ